MFNLKKQKTFFNKIKIKWKKENSQKSIQIN